MARKRLAIGLILLASAATAMTGCSPSETKTDRLARAETLSEVVEIIATKAPEQAYTVESTKYLAVVFGDSQVTRDYHLLTTKQLMPVLLERHPEIDRFFLAWKKDETQFLKIEFERDRVQGVNWEGLMIKRGDVQELATMYWAIPALR